jgi:hypothetical protein
LARKRRRNLALPRSPALKVSFHVLSPWRIRMSVLER